MPKPLTTAEFIRRATKKHGDRYDYSEAVYTKASFDVTIICRDCKTRFTRPARHHIQRAGCPRCHRLDPMTTENFIAKSRIKHRDRYDYSKSVFVKSSEKVSIYCKRCETDFWQRATTHVAGHGHRHETMDERSIEW